MGWPPDVTRRQRHGDLLAIADQLREDAQKVGG